MQATELTRLSISDFMPDRTMLIVWDCGSVQIYRVPYNLFSMYLPCHGHYLNSADTPEELEELLEKLSLALEDCLPILEYPIVTNNELVIISGFME